MKRWFGSGLLVLLVIATSGCTDSKVDTFYVPAETSTSTSTPTPTSTPIEAGAWGPDRDLFSIAAPAGHPTMNSITDNPAQGFEPGFFRAKLVDMGNESYSGAIDVEGGGTYDGFVYFGNSVATNIPDGDAVDVRLSIALPAVVHDSAHANALLYSSNTDPPEVWSAIGLNNVGDSDVAIRFVHGSAQIHTRGAVDGASLDTAELLSEQGVLLGCDELDGRLSGETRCYGYVSFQFVADFPDFSVEQSLQLRDSGQFGPRVVASPGDIVEVRVGYANIGSTMQNNVVVIPQRIAGTEVVQGSLSIKNSSNPDGKTLGGDADLVFDGINIGDYAPGANAFLKFSVRILRVGALECGGRWLYVNSRVETNNGWKSPEESIIDVVGVC